MALRSKTPEEREFFRNNRNLSIWWFVGVYFLNLMDAYVDAQLWHFDTGPDLGGGGGNSAVISLKFSWNF
jgi:hypothetical protein